ncbi:hypothetical protein [Candidatus Poriferisocius sp.]|uniref:DODA-type extradiol aromatic ring-opening family dioxygenase n=1 Tax=Candidatus Poriferisocius sp. TaxID=3101276 RepID=UPI003B5A10FE
MTIVAAFATVHAPFIAGMPELAPPEKREAVARGFERLTQQLDRVRAEVIITVSSEHITNFVGDETPGWCVSVGDTNPTQPEFGLPDRSVPGHPDLARALVDAAARTGFPLEARNQLRLDHGTNLPLSFVRPGYDIPVVPILVNTVWAPFPSPSSADDLGTLLARFAAERDERVVVMGTGGISHWVGNRNHGSMNGDFDRHFVGLVMDGDREALRSLSDADIEPGGDGAHEIRTWITSAGAAAESGLAPELVLAEPHVPGWNVGVYQIAWTSPEGQEAPEVEEEDRARAS